MSMQHIQPLPARALRGSRPGTLREVLGQRLAWIGRAVWQALQAEGQRRGDRELRLLAERWRTTSPKLARELTSYLNGGSSY